MGKKMFSGWDKNNNRVECSVVREEDKERIIRAFRTNGKVVKITMNGELIWGKR